AQQYTALYLSDRDEPVSPEVWQAWHDGLLLRLELIDAHNTVWPHAAVMKALDTSPGLKSLRLGSMQITTEELVELLDHQASRLDSLTLSGLEIGVVDILDSAGRVSPTHLSLYRVGLDAAGAARLARAGVFKDVTSLELLQNPIGDEGLATIVDAVERPLVRLTLVGCDLTAAGLASLAELDLRYVEVLDLGGNDLDDSAIEALLGQHTFPRLRALRLDDTQV